MRRVVLVTDGDWQALYIDGTLVWEDHQIGASEALWRVKDVGPFTFEDPKDDGTYFDHEQSMFRKDVPTP